MQNNIAFVLRHSPHGTASAREALDAILASSAYCEQISLFFIADGVYQLSKGQKPQQSLQRNISPTFGMLELYDIEDIYFCQNALEQRGLQSSDLCLQGQQLSTQEISQRLQAYSQVIHF